MGTRKSLFLLALSVFFLFSASNPVLAAKKRVWGKSVITTPVKGGNLIVSAKFSGWKQYLNVSFRGVKNTQGVIYELIYTSNGIDQAAGGGVANNLDAVTKTIFLGTCSHAACTAHKNISNVRLKITYLSTGGQSIVKNFKVKY